MKILFGPGYEFLKPDFLESGQRLSYHLERFSHQEERVCLHEPIKGKPVCVVLSTLRAQDWIRLFLFIHSLRTRQASHIIACVPYMGYTRQNTTPDLCVGLTLAAGADAFMTCDPHQTLKSSRTYVVSAQNIWFKILRSRVCPQDVLLAPDRGRFLTLNSWSRDLGCEMAWIEKKRRGSWVHAVGLYGDVKGRDCWIVDDMMDTGQTLQMAVDLLKRRGARRIYAAITHVLPSPCLFNRLKAVDLAELWVAPTLAWRFKSLAYPVTVVSLAEPFVHALKHITSHAHRVP